MSEQQSCPYLLVPLIDPVIEAVELKERVSLSFTQASVARRVIVAIVI